MFLLFISKESSDILVRTGLFNLSGSCLGLKCDISYTMDEVKTEPRSTITGITNTGLVKLLTLLKYMSSVRLKH